MNGELFGFIKRFILAVILSVVAGYAWLLVGSLLAMGIATDSGKYHAAAQMFLLVTIVVAVFVTSFVVFYSRVDKPGMWTTSGLARVSIACTASLAVLLCLAAFIESSGGL